MNTIIEKIRAEIKIRLSANGAFDEEGDSAWHYDQGLNDAYNYILSFLSDLEKEEKPMELDFEQELYKHFGQVKDFTLGMRIGQYFYELGQQSKPKVSEDLNDEIKKFIEEYGYERGADKLLIAIAARHFAQWQKEQLMKDGNVILSEEDFDAEKEKSIEFGYNLCKEQTMKEAVECEVTETCGISSVWIKTKQFKPGQKVKLIIVKED